MDHRPSVSSLGGPRKSRRREKSLRTSERSQVWRAEPRARTPGCGPRATLVDCAAARHLLHNKLCRPSRVRIGA